MNGRNKAYEVLYMDSTTVFSIIVGVSIVLMAVTIIIIALDKK